ncbi:hypothetical protein AAFF_G00145260 [Aldrovandia affinis]|uniref:Uncharacterized protein n=1 Tax=Aldrovandia affinis TaxID=143900 RepID=A0AAD7WXX0_9TELE|nr:hypothetical protein AAFF_G00145260 [Aldrovandia affinis]
MSLDGQEVSLQQYQVQVKRQKEELFQRKEDLGRKFAMKGWEVKDLENTLSMAKSRNEAAKTKECEKKVMEQELRALLEKHAHKSGQMRELKKDVKGMNVSLDELLHEEREDLGKQSLIQDLQSEIHAQEEELKKVLKQANQPTECKGRACQPLPASPKLSKEADLSEQLPQDTKPANQPHGSPCLLTNQQQDSRWGSTDACWGSSSTPNSRHLLTMALWSPCAKQTAGVKTLAFRQVHL